MGTRLDYGNSLILMETRCTVNIARQEWGPFAKMEAVQKATGRGAGSHHGGVKQWVFNTSMKKVGGTGKYMTVEHRVALLKEKAKQKLNLSQNGL